MCLKKHAIQIIYQESQSKRLYIYIYICNIYIFCIIAKATKTHARSLHPRFMKIMAHSIGTQTNPHQNHTSMQASFRWNYFSKSVWAQASPITKLDCKTQKSFFIRGRNFLQQNQLSESSWTADSTFEVPEFSKRGLELCGWFAAKRTRSRSGWVIPFGGSQALP